MGVHREPAGHACLGRDRGVVVVDPLLRLARLDERERQRSDPLRGRQVDRLPPAASDPERWMRLLERLGDDIAGRHLEEVAVVAGEGLLYEHPGHRVEGLVPLGPLALTVDQEAAQLGFRRRLAGAELHPAVADQIQRGDTFGHPGRVVEVERQLDDAVAQPDVLGPLAGRGEEHLGGRRVAVLLEEVVLDLPHVIDAQLVGQLDLVEGVLQQTVFVVRLPRSGQLMLVEDAELHGSRTPPQEIVWSGVAAAHPHQPAFSLTSRCKHDRTCSGVWPHASATAYSSGAKMVPSSWANPISSTLVGTGTVVPATTVIVRNRSARRQTGTRLPAIVAGCA